MTFQERVENFICFACFDVVVPLSDNMYWGDVKIKFGLNNTSDIRNTFSRAKLVFLNTDFIYDTPMPLMPNVIAIGGIDSPCPRS